MINKNAQFPIQLHLTAVNLIPMRVLLVGSYLDLENQNRSEKVLRIQTGKSSAEMQLCGKWIIRKKYQHGKNYKGKKKRFANLQITFSYEQSISPCIQSTAGIHPLTKKGPISLASAMPDGDLLPATDTKYQQD